MPFYSLNRQSCVDFCPWLYIILSADTVINYCTLIPRGRGIHHLDRELLGSTSSYKELSSHEHVMVQSASLERNAVAQRRNHAWKSVKWMVDESKSNQKRDGVKKIRQRSRPTVYWKEKVRQILPVRLINSSNRLSTWRKLDENREVKRISRVPTERKDSSTSER